MPVRAITMILLRTSWHLAHELNMNIQPSQMFARHKYKQQHVNVHTEGPLPPPGKDRNLQPPPGRSSQSIPFKDTTKEKAKERAGQDAPKRDRPCSTASLGRQSIPCSDQLYDPCKLRSHAQHPTPPRQNSRAPQQQFAATALRKKIKDAN